jgi:hypothetical protein
MYGKTSTNCEIKEKTSEATEAHGSSGRRVNQFFDSLNFYQAAIGALHA